MSKSSEREETQVTDLQTKAKPELKCGNNNEASWAIVNNEAKFFS